MCTLTYYPLGRARFILTSNRDESVDRAPATLPQLKNVGDKKVLMPVDPEGGGTWVAADDHGRVACLLNGAFEPYRPAPPYAKSRGLVVTDLFSYEQVEAFADEYPLDDIGTDQRSIEPFTLVILENTPELKGFELRWDGSNRFFKRLNMDEPQLWTSRQLYSKELDETSVNRYHEFLSQRQSIDREALREFNYQERYKQKFKDSSDKPVEGLVTSSITGITHGKDTLEHYFDELDSGVKTHTSFPLKTRIPL